MEDSRSYKEAKKIVIGEIENDVNYGFKIISEKEINTNWDHCFSNAYKSIQDCIIGKNVNKCDINVAVEVHKILDEIKNEKNGRKVSTNGGMPVRSEPYPKHTTMIDKKEEQLVIELLRDGELSGFSGRPGDRFLGGKYVKEMEQKVKEILG